MSLGGSQSDFSDVESRRSTRSRRRLGLIRQLYYACATPLMRIFWRLLTSTYRVHGYIGKEVAEQVLSNSGTVYSPCYWHQNHILCSNMLRSWFAKGFRGTFLVSASVDGEMPARIAEHWGANVIRGSANQTGALALRDMQQQIKNGNGIVTTADGPSGPKQNFKLGTILMARIGQTHLVPLACAAEHAWFLDRWDDFMIPKPFSRVVLGVGQPMVVPLDTSLDQLEGYRVKMESDINSLMTECQQLLASKET